MYAILQLGEKVYEYILRTGEPFSIPEKGFGQVAVKKLWEVLYELDAETPSSKYRPFQGERECSENTSGNVTLVRNEIWS